VVAFFRSKPEERIKKIKGTFLCESPIVSTSVNRSGGAPLWQIEKIIKEFEKDVDLIADTGDLPGRKPSPILDVTSKPYKILRQGACNIPSEVL